jgi:hypothetical protein
MSPRLALRLSFALAALGGACSSSSNAPPPGALGAGGSADAGAAKDAASTAEVGADSADGGATRSEGCGLPPGPTQVLAKYIRHDEVVTGVAPAYVADYTNRFYWLRLPASYDPDRAYPTVFIGPGCGESGSAPIPIQVASKDDAILVGLNGFQDCLEHDHADTPELQYFDATLGAVEASACVDTSRIFVTGFSAGSWLASYLGCARGNLLRAQATVAGGLPPIPSTCTGPIPAMYVADTDDLHNPPETVKKALARVLTANGCGTDTQPYDCGVQSPCVQYQGCLPGFPVVYCETSGVGHADQSTTQISTVGFWHFWTSLD